VLRRIGLLRGVVIIDEIQRMPKLFEVLRIWSARRRRGPKL
jgi:hypothetical protein